MKKIPLFLLISHGAWAQTLAPLTVEKIMRDPKWIGVAPSNLNWSYDSKQLYFSWNPENNPGDSLYSITLINRAPQKVAAATRRALPSRCRRSSGRGGRRFRCFGFGRAMIRDMAQGEIGE